MSEAPPWLSITRGEAPLIVSMPHTGTRFPWRIGAALISPWLARKDADWWVDQLYDFAADLGATVIRTAISRTVIDVNRDPSGKSLYPGQNTTELCPTTTFDGEPLYRDSRAPDAQRNRAPTRRFFSIPITPPSAPRSPGCANVTTRSCCSRRIRSAREFPACSTANCRISTSGPTAARVARPN